MIANYHTHTIRCRHASDDERAYIERAIEGGIRILGFSDHAPMVFDGDYYSNFRMPFDQLDDYVSTLSALREEYRDRIDIRIGLEAEYYPRYFHRFLERIKGKGIEYLILGQHFTRNEHDGIHSNNGSDDLSRLISYTDSVIAGMETGVFTYVAHPDVFHYRGTDTDAHRAQLARICACAKERSIPLEVNFLGIQDHRCYPSELFLDVVAEYGCDVILGCDAHSAQCAWRPDTEEIALEMLAKRGMKPLSTVNLISPFPS